MALALEILRLLEALTADEIETLPPIERQRLAQRLRYLADVADKAGEPASGVLRELKDRDG